MNVAVKAGKLWSSPPASDLHVSNNQRRVGVQLWERAVLNLKKPSRVYFGIGLTNIRNTCLPVNLSDLLFLLLQATHKLRFF